MPTIEEAAELPPLNPISSKRKFLYLYDIIVSAEIRLVRNCSCLICIGNTFAVSFRVFQNVGYQICLEGMHAQVAPQIILVPS